MQNGEFYRVMIDRLIVVGANKHSCILSFFHFWRIFMRGSLHSFFCKGHKVIEHLRCGGEKKQEKEEVRNGWEKWKPVWLLVVREEKLSWNWPSVALCIYRKGAPWSIPNQPLAAFASNSLIFFLPHAVLPLPQGEKMQIPRESGDYPRTKSFRALTPDEPLPEGWKQECFRKLLQ